MTQRVIFCADIRFPRGDAGANRIQYVANTLQEIGYDVFIVSCGENEYDGTYTKYYEGIRYQNIKIGDNKIRRIFDTKMNSGNKILDIAKMHALSSKDIVYIYGSNAFFVNPIRKYCLKNNIRCVIDVVEWHQPFQYKLGRYDPRYISANYTFIRLAHRIRNIIAISSCIQNYYGESCNSIVIPALIDTKRILMSKEKSGKKIHLIYPGNPFTKDDIRVMLKGLLELSLEERSNIAFHSTGISEKMLRDFLGEEQTILDDLGDTLIIHGRLEYQELEKLYNRMDFLFMSRPDTLVTEANFPSKVPELMSWGIVPICNKQGDYADYLTDGVDSILFLKNTPSDCAMALRRGINTSIEMRNKMKIAARKCAEDNFDYRKWSQKVERFFKGLV